LRIQSAEYISSLGFDGIGIGGVFETGDIETEVKWVNQTVPESLPRHLLGMGAQPADLFLGVEYGIDTFDCVAPTRQARNGAIYTATGRINIRNTGFMRDFSPLDKNCECYACQGFSRAYINHLFRSDEILGAILASIHNEYFVVHMVDNIRQSIIDGTFYNLKDTTLKKYY
ncbi:MAG: queuine tRNA-ribosyltransferase, partial [Patescibacteria group bacterium]|nr:queuine tRNA-ribosyltransferase [Patescibacteria group bacterium]